MIRNISQLEHKIGDRVYHMMCDSTSPLNEVKDALFQFLKYVGQIEDSMKAQQEAQKAAEAPVPVEADPVPIEVKAE